MTQTALASGSSPTILATTTPDLSQQNTPTDGAVAPQASGTPSLLPYTPTPICNLAQAGRPIDVTIPDDTKMDPASLFVKTWRLVNGGSCTWTSKYGIVWFSGDDIGVLHQEALKGNVQPGQSVDISVDMMSPENPGSYQSNWKLSNERGELFGIGPGGGSPFWVRIEVIAVDTPTPTAPLPTLTLTPHAAFSGSVTLEANQGVNLDDGRINSGADDDLFLHVQDTTFELELKNGAREGRSLTKAPTLAECQAAAMNADPIPLGAEFTGSFFCVKTSRGLPGNFTLVSIDAAKSRVGIAFTIWSVP